MRGFEGMETVLTSLKSWAAMLLSLNKYSTHVYLTWALARIFLILGKYLCILDQGA
jgi:hypothetical protein